MDVFHFVQHSEILHSYNSCYWKPPNISQHSKWKFPAQHKKWAFLSQPRFFSKGRPSRRLLRRASVNGRYPQSSSILSKDCLCKPLKKIQLAFGLGVSPMTLETHKLDNYSYNVNVGLINRPPSPPQGTYIPCKVFPVSP